MYTVRGGSASHFLGRLLLRQFLSIRSVSLAQVHEVPCRESQTHERQADNEKELKGAGADVLARESRAIRSKVHDRCAHKRLFVLAG
jgi:hypothetical protein